MSNTFDFLIEVVVPPGTSATERGRVLERLGDRFLQTQNYAVAQEVRLTATEVDLLAAERTTGERILVECKAYRSPIASEVLDKLLGAVTRRKYAAGWLLSTFALSKDAKGFEEEWNREPPAERRKLQIYPPQQLVERLISARILVDPASLSIDKVRFNLGTDAVLLLTLNAEYWAIPVVDKETGLRDGALLFRADSGLRVVEAKTFELLNATDTTLKLPWLNDTRESQQIAATKLHEELQSIVRVPVADHWADYRPARPVDFVGREGVQNDIFSFFESVRTGTSQTRVLALKGPSGWGKSSTVLKIAARAANARNRGKFFVFPVDSRAATTGRFPELAIATAVKAAVEAGFIGACAPLEFGGASSIFSTPGMRGIAKTLEADKKVLCVFFDQFEELLYKVELSDVFDQMRSVCAAVEEAQVNLIVGFSWKTDGVIPTEHSAYHMWHRLADRRLEIGLVPFSEPEVTKAVNRFAKELGQPLIPQLRRVLQDHSQGFPWLLKKLCVHILDLARSGIEQADILTQSVNIESLFKRDLETIDTSEHACLKQVAQESPAEFFKVAQNFGDDVVARLIDKRLVIRSGTRLTIYWDIFRDYVLTNKIPHIPVTYTPQANIGRYAMALSFMVGKSQLTYKQLGEHMGLAMGATDNLVRDLANLGHVEANRKEAYMVPTFTTERDAIAAAVQYWNKHEILRRVREAAGEGVLSQDEFVRIYAETNKRADVHPATSAHYAVRVLGWLRGLGIVAQLGNTLMLADDVQQSVIALKNLSIRRMSDIFLGEAPPAKVVAAFRAMCISPVSRAQLESEHGRNACYVLLKLGLMRPDAAQLVPASPEQAETVVATRAFEAPTVKAAVELMRTKTGLSGLEYGKHLAERFGTTWSEGSQRRCGTALRQWAEWSYGVVHREPR